MDMASTINDGDVSTYIFISSLVADEPELLTDILDSSIRKNRRNGVTGMMLFVEGNVR
jgi:hypothetical protein